MTLSAPEWLLLLPALLFVSWYWRRPDLRDPLRLAIVTLLTLTLCEPVRPGAGRGLDVWLLVDRSASAADLLAPRLPEIEGLLEGSRSRRDRLFVVDFADEAQRRSDADGGVYAGSRAATRLATAIELAAGAMQSDRAARILAVTDGFSTEPVRALEARLRAQGVPLDVRLVRRPVAADWSVEAVRMPARVQAGEPFEIEVAVTGEPDADVAFALRRDGAVVAEGVVTVRGGRGTERFSDRVGRAGAAHYEVELVAGGAHSGNDRKAAWVEVTGGPRVLLVTAYDDDPLAAVLREQGFELDVVREPRRLGLGQLTGARAVVLNNVPADRIPGPFLAALGHFVNVQGGGLLMAGGEHSFGSGGYFESAVDALLPVTMELRQDHRAFDVAMAIVMDRSGSMAAGVAGGKTKMDLANEGAARSIELLGPRDAVCVYAVDSEAHEIAPLTPAGNKAELVDQVRRIESMGGGIFVYEGLAAAWQQLRSAPQHHRHVILFADAADSEQPGAYRDLIAEMTAANGTVSVIGLGSEADSDAALLTDIARLGDGRMFFSSDPETLPAVFAQETVAVARSAFIDAGSGVVNTAGWLEMSDRDLDGLAAVDGYNLSYLREGASAALLTTDEYEAPLVAFWQRGAGRTAAVSFPIGGEHSQAVRSWPRYGDFLATLGRWLGGDEVPAGIGLRSRVEGDELALELLFDETWEGRVAREPPVLLLAEGATGEATEVTWSRIAPGRFRATKRLRGGTFYRGAVGVGGATLPFGPIAAPGGAEWALQRGRLSELLDLVAATGGVERTDLASIWSAMPVTAPGDLRPLFLALFAALFVFEAFAARIGWRWPHKPWERLAAAVVGLRSRRWRRPETAPRRPPVAAAAIESTPLEGTGERASPEPRTGASEGDADRRRSRFARAKRGR